MGEVKALEPVARAIALRRRTRPGWTSSRAASSDHVETQTDEAMMPNQVSQRVAEEAAGETPILRPIFEPGDALLFDELFLHKTASDPAMRQPPLRDRELVLRPVGLP